MHEKHMPFPATPSMPIHTDIPFFLGAWHNALLPPKLKDLLCQ
jgi:hypothetical protein